MSGALNTIYKKRNYKIYDAGSEYIVHNTSLCFEEHHTHINNFNTCKYIINLSIYKRVPKHLSDYLLVSLIRLSDSKSYTRKIENLLEQNNSRKKYKIKDKAGDKEYAKRINKSKTNSRSDRCKKN